MTDLGLYQTNIDSNDDGSKDCSGVDTLVRYNVRWANYVNDTLSNWPRRKKFSSEDSSVE